MHRTLVEISTVQLQLLGSEGRTLGDLPAPFEVELDPCLYSNLHLRSSSMESYWALGSNLMGMNGVM